MFIDSLCGPLPVSEFDPLSGVFLSSTLGGDLFKISELASDSGCIMIILGMFVPIIYMVWLPKVGKTMKWLCWAYGRVEK